MSFHDALVEVLASKVGVAVSGEHLEDAVVDGQDADDERAAAEVEHEHLLLWALVVDTARGPARSVHAKNS